MIESEAKRGKLLELLERWARTTKIKALLRSHDIPGLVDSIVGMFYPVTLSCGHKVRDIEESVQIAFKDVEGVVSSLYCSECAERYIKELGAWKVGEISAAMIPCSEGSLTWGQYESSI